MVERITIDRFEGEYAVCEVGNALHTRAIKKSALPAEAKPGDTLYWEDNGWKIDIEETAARAKRIRERFERIKKS